MSVGDPAVETSALHCVNHPSVETVVRCSRCEKPICPKCMIATPVGMRCRECANLRRPPMYEVHGAYLWRAIGLALLLTLPGGFAFALLAGTFGRSIFLAAILYLAAGAAIAEALSWAANRKRGPRLQALSVATVIVATQLGPLIALVVSRRLSANVIELVLTAVACAIAWTRLR